MNRTRTAGLYIGGFAIVAAAACGKSGSPADGDLAHDLAAAKGSAAPGLELAPRAGNSLVVVSAIEGGPQAAPKRAVAPAPRPAAPHAIPQLAAPTPSAAAAATPPAPQPTKTSERAADPAPLPPASGQGTNRERQRGTYSTEAEIFHRMPWIRP